MADSTDLTIDSQISRLRAELKEWEHAFAAKNEGRKAGREDIKREPEIAAKYKTYARLRASVTSSQQNDAAHGEQGDTLRIKKRKHQEEAGDDYHARLALTTPRKAAKHNRVLTPLKQPQEPGDPGRDKLHPSHLDLYKSPTSSRKVLIPSRHTLQGDAFLSPIHLRNAIGPTPQRDGKVLGLFDLLSASAKSNSTAATPSGRRTRLADAQTPSKSQRIHGNDTGDDFKDFPTTPSAQRSGVGALRTRRYSLTPASSAKKFYLSKFFATPTVGSRFVSIAEEANEEVGGNGVISPAKPSGLETPSFLRRRSLFSRPRNPAAAKGAANELATGDFSPMAVRMPHRVIGKGLSALVQGLRDMEDEELEDEMDVLRELEAEEAGIGGGERVLVEDSQVPTGTASRFDRRESELDTAGSPSKSRKPWKKIGQKRTTKLVTMRPTRAKPKQAPQWETIMEERTSEEEDEELIARPSTDASIKDVVPESQTPGQEPPSDDDDQSYEHADDPDDDEEDYTPAGSLLRALSKSRKRGVDLARKLTMTEKNKAANTPQDEKAKKSKLKKPKKIKAEAHANYRALKIRSRGNSGPKGRFGGRFGKRR